jgi:hypothetical protein
VFDSNEYSNIEMSQHNRMNSIKTEGKTLRNHHYLKLNSLYSKIKYYVSLQFQELQSNLFSTATRIIHKSPINISK